MLECEPLILIDGNRDEVMTFYHTCIDGELTRTKLGEPSMKDSFPLEKCERIINANLKRGEIIIPASDGLASLELEL